MAKSMRSKVKRSFRSKKRETGVYAATEAARLNRLNSKLVTAKDKREETLAEEGDGMELLDEEATEETPGRADEMEFDSKASQRISTHGPRGSRNEEWRLSKGMTPRPKSRGMNRQGGPAAKRKASRPARRR